MIAQSFSETLETKKISQSLSSDSVCRLGYVFIIQPGSLQLCLLIHFLLVQRLKVNKRGELWAFSVFFCVFTQLYVCMWPSRFQEICQCFSNHLCTIHLPAFPLKPFGQPTVCPRCYPLPQAEAAKVFAWKCFQYASFRWQLWHWGNSESSEIKTSFLRRSSREASYR